MANLSFYAEKYGVTSQSGAFQRFVASLQNYYDSAYYVDWAKALANAGRYETELALLTTLCRKPDRVEAARHLLRRYPQIIPALPILVACRGPVALVEDLENAKVTSYDFVAPGMAGLSEDVDRYTAFLVASGLIDLLDHIGSVKDYVIGVEVGMDTNARKNRGGNCGIRAISPWVKDVFARHPEIAGGAEVSSDRLRQIGCPLPASATGVVWDYAFWTRSAPGRRFVVMEVNHYGSSGSKPSAIAREYTAREADLRGAGVGFVWVTDGMGWHAMLNPLREAFSGLDWLVNVRLAADGMLAHAVRSVILK